MNKTKIIILASLLSVTVLVGCAKHTSVSSLFKKDMPTEDVTDSNSTDEGATSDEQTQPTDGQTPPTDEQTKNEGEQGNADEQTQPTDGQTAPGSEQPQTGDEQAQPQTTFKVGDKGDKVKELQTLLNKFNYDLNADGNFGQKTEWAVMDFQTRNELQADGVVGDSTFEKLNLEPTEKTTYKEEPAKTEPTPNEPSGDSNESSENSKPAPSESNSGKPVIGGCYTVPYGEPDQYGTRHSKFVINGESITYPEWGDRWATVSVPRIGVSGSIYQGDSSGILSQGIGHYYGSYIVGEGGKCVLAAHNNMEFRNLEYVKMGDKVTVKTSYGTYVYEVSDITVGSENDEWRLQQTGEECLLLYTCYPFPSNGTDKRLYVTCRYAN